MFVDWALITQTMERLETLSATETLAEIASLRDMDPQLADAVDWLEGGQENARSFMQTRIRDLAEVDGPSFAQGDRVGAWRIAERIGAGGMGEVYRAERADGLFEQQVALKLAKVESATLRERFDAERQRLAQLEHPNIARIVDGGVSHDGAPYMTMEFVDGQAIDAYAKAHTLDRKAKLGLIEKLCGAVGHAHGRLVLHRDIKHDNVLINNDGELRLIDFGVASLVDDTSEEAVRGPLTLAYAAPEQLRGEPVSAATDIFAIGMLAHFLETRSLPKRLSEGGVAIDRGAIGDEDLAAILSKATAFEPVDRYASADALAQDLHKFLSGFPVAARPVSAITRFKKLVARNRLASAMSGAAVLALLAGVIGVSVFAMQADEEANRARFAEQQGARTIEFYETINGGYTRFTSSIDPASPLGQEYSKALLELESAAQENAQADPQGTLQTYVFLAEFYADQGLDRDASRIGEKLDQHATELNYGSAFTLSGLVHLSRGFVEDEKLIARLDRLYAFFSADPVAHSFDMAMNRCVKAEFTKAKSDAQSCVDMAKAHIAKVDMKDYSAAAGTLPLFLYGVDGALALKDFEQAEAFAKEALEFYENESRPGSVPEALIWMGLSDIAQAREDWAGSIEHLMKVEKLLEGDDRLPWLEVSLSLEKAQSRLALEDYSGLGESANTALQKAEALYGADHYQARDARSFLAMAEAGEGRVARATEMLNEIIAEERRGDNNAESIDKYNDMLKSASQM